MRKTYRGLQAHTTEVGINDFVRELPMCTLIDWLRRSQIGARPVLGLDMTVSCGV